MLQAGWDQLQGHLVDPHCIVYDNGTMADGALPGGYGVTTSLLVREICVACFMAHGITCILTGLYTDFFSNHIDGVIYLAKGHLLSSLHSAYCLSPPMLRTLQMHGTTVLQHIILWLLGLSSQCFRQG